MRPLIHLLMIVTLSLMPWLHSQASELEVLHWWTSKGEKRALDELKKAVYDSGYEWVDFAVTGGGGGNAFKVLRSRVISGNPPATAQIKGETVRDWAKLGLLTDIDGIARAGHWDQVLPKALQDELKVNNHYYAVPLGVHRINCMWVNPDLFAQIKQPVPGSLAEFLTVAPKLKQAGIAPLTIGQQDWQYVTLFETVLLDSTSAAFYRKSLVDFDLQAFNSIEMVRVFEVLASLRALLPSPIVQQKWDSATQQLMSGQAAMQLNGDWVKGELLAAGKKPGEDILCIPVSGQQSAFIYTLDSMVLFNSTDKQQQKAQLEFTRIAMKPELQAVFNHYKGSLPARQDIETKTLDAYAQKNLASFNISLENQTLLPSVAHSMTGSTQVKQSIFRVLKHFFENPEVTPEEASKQLAMAIRASI